MNYFFEENEDLGKEFILGTLEPSFPPFSHKIGNRSKNR